MTAKGGYLTKQGYATFQGIVIDTDGTDCGTKMCLDIHLTEKNIDLYMYQNIKLENGMLVNLNPDNYKEYINKYLQVRTPMFCLSNKICNKCAGSRFELLQIKNVGLTSVRVSNNLMNLNMKKRHQMKITLDEVDINSLVI